MSWARSFELQEKRAMARHGLQACHNLLSIFIANGDAEAVHYFQLRLRFYRREIARMEVVK